MRDRKRTPESPMRALSPRPRWRFHLWRGARALEAGDLRGARRHFAAAFRQAPEEPLVCLAWGRELARSGHPVAAEGLLERAAQLDPDLIPAVLERARVLGTKLGRRPEAEDLLDVVEARQGDSAAIRLLRAEMCLLDPVDAVAARHQLEQALVLGADAGAVRRRLARVLNAEGVARSLAGEHQLALDALGRAADLDPRWAGPIVNVGAVLERTGQLVQAREQYRRALALEPANATALENLASSLRKAGGSVEAERLYRRLGLVPASPSDRSAAQARPGFEDAGHGPRLRSPPEKRS